MAERKISGSYNADDDELTIEQVRCIVEALERTLFIAKTRFDDMMTLRRLNAQLQAEIRERNRVEADRPTNYFSRDPCFSRQQKRGNFHPSASRRT